MEPIRDRSPLMKGIADLINNGSWEYEANIPDFILAEFLTVCFNAVNDLVEKRDKWYSIKPEPGWSNPDNRMYEAIGATYAKACILADQGKDIRKIEFPVIAEEIVKGLTGKVCVEKGK